MNQPFFFSTWQRWIYSYRWCYISTQIKLKLTHINVAVQWYQKKQLIESLNRTVVIMRQFGNWIFFLSSAVDFFFQIQFVSGYFGLFHIDARISKIKSVRNHQILNNRNAVELKCLNIINSNWNYLGITQSITNCLHLG